MTEACREQYPLLHEDLSDEEQFGPQRRYRPMAVRSRVRNKVKGAACIFKRWPGYWSTAVIYWWIGLGMIVIIMLLIYNGLSVFALLPPEGIETPLVQNINYRTKEPFLKSTSSLPDVYMNVHVNSYEEIDLNKYLPYIKILSNQYNDYNYHLFIVINDVDSQSHDLLASEESKYNEIALNSLLHNSSGREKRESNGVLVEQIFLTKFLDGSPINKHWRNIPYNLIEFLVRAVLIWDKGGIAFNPIILTPHYPQDTYIEKIETVLRKYRNNSYNEDETSYHQGTYKKDRKNFDNIRDIIDAMDIIDYKIQDIAKEEKETPTSLETAESRLLSPVFFNIFNDTKEIIHKISDSMHLYEKSKKAYNYETEKSLNINKNNTNTLNFQLVGQISEMKKITNDSNSALLNHLNNNQDVEKITSVPIVSRKRKSIIHKKKVIPSNEKEVKENPLIGIKIINDTYNNYHPMIILANKTNFDMPSETKYNEKPIIKTESRSKDHLTIDLKGNILATRIPCHAFIGTLFSNVVHREQKETITEFIINELSLFCKGVLSSCNGIDVILL